MALTRTRTMGMQDTVVSVNIPSITAVSVRRHVSPINGHITRVIAVRGSALSTPEGLTLTTVAGTTVLTMPTGGAAGDVDTFELGRVKANRVGVEEVVSIFNDGDPAETTQLNIYLVISRE